MPGLPRGAEFRVREWSEEYPRVCGGRKNLPTPPTATNQTSSRTCYIAISALGLDNVTSQFARRKVFFRSEKIGIGDEPSLFFCSPGSSFLILTPNLPPWRG